MDMDGPDKLGIVAAKVCEQLFASLTTIVYVPAATPIHGVQDH